MNQEIGIDIYTLLYVKQITNENLLYNKAGDTGEVSLIPESARSLGGNGNPFQYSQLENSMDRGAWWATHGVEKESDTTEHTTNTKNQESF